MRTALSVCAVAVAVLAAGCVTHHSGKLVNPSNIRGHIEGVSELPAGAYVQILRLDADGLPTPDPFERVTPDETGKFSTDVLSAGRYRLVYRPPDGPPSAVTVRVPTHEPTTLRPLVVAKLVALTVKSPEAEAVRCVLTEASPPEGVADVREFECKAETPATVRGLRPGRYYLDLPARGMTTEVDVPAGTPMRDLVLDPPAETTGGGIGGQVRRTGGEGAAWVVVSARPVTGEGEKAERWGRYATTDRAGSYKILGIPPGNALVRVECRQWPARRLPAARTAAIPPSGMIELGFVIEP